MAAEHQEMSSDDEQPTLSAPNLGNDIADDDIDVVRATFTPTAAAELDEQQSRLLCRFYENKFPAVDDLVVANVRQIAEMGAYVQLLEYNNIEGMILLSELSRKRIRSVQKLVRVGRNEVVVVLRVDKDKGYIDLSKRRVSPEDIAKCEDKYNKAKTVHSIMRHVAEKTGSSLEELLEKYVWPLDRSYPGRAFEAFRLAINDPDAVFGSMDISDEIRDEVLNGIRRRMTPNPVKIRADVEVTCFAYEGVDAIKAALQAGEGVSTEEVPIKVKLVAPPLYVVTTSSLDKTAGIATMQAAIEVMESTIKSQGGSLIVKMSPRAVSANDDAELAKLMAQKERENAEISGDEEDGDDVENDE
ncbi:hypothetical protein HDU85_002316 [Gaertneriomyces sp. JEL0708]|nr:hypothetical protein HDU85_002316 [Gaertneriomyces sp. JEL0708]